MERFRMVIELFDLLWTEDRVETILSSKWSKYSNRPEILTEEISKALEIFDGLESLEDKKSFVESFSEEMVECLLVDLAREMRAMKKVCHLEDYRDEVDNTLVDNKIKVVH